MVTFRRPVGVAAVVILTLSQALWATRATASAPLVQQAGNGKGAVDWTAGVITVTGSGAPPEKGSAGQKRLLAQRAAVVDGYRQLAEILNGVHVDSETVVKDMVTASDTIRTQVSGLVKGAQRGATRYQSDGAVEVDLQVPMYGASSLFSAVDFNHKLPQQSSALPPTYDLGARVSPLRLAQAGGAYTGLIVNCGNLGVEPAMSPAILDESGTELYVGKLPIDADQVVNQGIVGYRTSLNDAMGPQSRVGDHPLVLQATRTSGHFKADVVLTAADGQALMDANQVAAFLPQSRVVFVVRPAAGS